MPLSKYLIFAASSVLVAAASLASGSPLVQSASRVAPTFTDAQAERGGGVYDQRCGQCHGAALDDGSFGPPLTGRLFVEKWQDRSLAEVFKVIRTQMPTEAPEGGPPPRLRGMTAVEEAGQGEQVRERM